MTTMTPLEKFARAIGAAVLPDARVNVDEWAEQNRILPPDTPEPGPYRNHRTPYLVDIQRAMSPGSGYREGWFQKPVQIGGSVSGENMIGSWICNAAGSILVVFPTLDDGRQWELTRFEPMRSSTRALRRRVRPADEKGSDNTKLRKRYPGGVMRLVGANRVGALKSATIRYVKFEEPDEYASDLGDQGSPLRLAMGRTVNFGRKAKIYGDGTPTLQGRSAIAAQHDRGDQRKWHLHCPECQHPQPLKFENLKWRDDEPDTAAYACEACGVLSGEAAWKTGNYKPRPAGISEAEAKALGLAYWEATAQGEPGVASWHLEALAAPIGWRPWSMLAAEWLAAQGDEEKLKIFYNNFRGLPYALKLGTEIGADALQKRAERYELMTCPAGGLLVIASTDTQDNRLAVVIRAFGRNEESWGVWHGEIYGDTSRTEVWAKLRTVLETPIKHECGQVMHVAAAAIDSGGHRTEEVYAFCRDAQLRGKHWFAVKGSSTYDAPKLGRPKKVEFTWRGQPVPGGAELRMVGTQAIKNLIDGRLKLTRPGAGGMYHWPLGFQADYFKQMRAERREWQRDRRGRKFLWWVKGNERNEAWDCEVYAYAAFLYAMSGQHADSVWRKLEKVYGRTQQLDLLQPPADGAQIEVPATADQAEVEAPPPEAGEAQEPAEVVQPPVRSSARPDPFMQHITKAHRPPAKRKGGFVTGWRK